MRDSELNTNHLMRVGAEESVLKLGNFPADVESHYIEPQINTDYFVGICENPRKSVVNSVLRNNFFSPDGGGALFLQLCRRGAGAPAGALGFARFPPIRQVADGIQHGIRSDASFKIGWPEFAGPEKYAPQAELT